MAAVFTRWRTRLPLQRRRLKPASRKELALQLLLELREELSSRRGPQPQQLQLQLQIPRKVLHQVRRVLVLLRPSSQRQSTPPPRRLPRNPQLLQARRRKQQRSKSVTLSRMSPWKVQVSLSRRQSRKRAQQLLQKPRHKQQYPRQLRPTLRL